MGDDSHFVLHFSSLFSVGMYICSVLQIDAWQEDYNNLMSENRELKVKYENQNVEIANLKVELEAV